MREIKFRGKSLNDGRWLYGDLIHNGFDGTNEWPICIKEDGLCPEPVAPETAGEYTGLKDKNGKEIYEGDIVQYQAVIDGMPTKTKIKTDCVWSYGSNGFVFRGQAYYVVHFPSLEIIGNIHENPELIK